MVDDHRRDLNTFALRRLQAKPERRVACVDLAKELGLDGVLIDGTTKAVPQFDAFGGRNGGYEFPVLEGKNGDWFEGSKK